MTNFIDVRLIVCGCLFSDVNMNELSGDVFIIDHSKEG